MATWAGLYSLGSGRYFLLQLGRSLVISFHQQQLQPLQGHLIGRVKEAKVAHLMKALGQHMLQKAAKEFYRRQPHGLPFPGGGILVSEGYMIVFQGDDAVVGDGDPVS